MLVSNSPTLDNAFRACGEIAFRHYENFPVASIFIPKEKRKYVAAIYAFARTADDIADEDDIEKRTRLERLAGLRTKLQDCKKGFARDDLFIALGETINRFDLPMVYFDNLLTAFRMDAEKKRYESWRELVAYCSYSANPIGRLILQLFEYDGEDRLRASDAICTALQLTNFWQDLSIDIKKGRIYIPHEDLEAFDCPEEDILGQRVSANFRLLMAHEVNRTAALFEEGKTLLTSVGRDLQLQLSLTWLGGMKLLKKIQRINYDVFQTRSKLSLWDKCSMIVEATRRKRTFR